MGEQSWKFKHPHRSEKPGDTIHKKPGGPETKLCLTRHIASDFPVPRFRWHTTVTPIFFPHRNPYSQHLRRNNDSYQSTSGNQDVLCPASPEALHLSPYLCPLFTQQEHQLLGATRRGNLSSSIFHLKEVWRAEWGEGRGIRLPEKLSFVFQTVAWKKKSLLSFSWK